MWKEKTVSVVMPCYNEEEYIRPAIEDFSQDYVDEIIVVDNNSTDGSTREVAQTRARLVTESRQGYGYALRRGMAEAKGDLIILTEPDGTFRGTDMMKLLVYSDDFDCVFGTRTSKALIWDGSNMGSFLKWGNWFVGKLLEVLFSGPNLTDVGCTMRLIKKEALEKIQSQFTVGGNWFSPEMMLLVLHNGIRSVEVSLNYCPRVGTSTITGKKWKAFKLGCRMIGLIGSRWLRLKVLRLQPKRAPGGLTNRPGER